MLYILFLIIQYTILIIIYQKKPNWINGEEMFGIIPWFPILGPVAIIFGLIIIGSVILFFAIPILIANLIIWIVNVFLSKKLEYLK